MNDKEEIIHRIYSLECHKKTSYYNKTTFPSEVGAPTYGELRISGVDILLEEFKKYFNEDAVFYDLGCGLGKIVFHIGIKTPLKKVCGIEYSKERYQGCIDIHNNLCSFLTNVSFINDSYLNININDATIIYIDNTAIMDEEIYKNIFSNIPPQCLVIHQTQFGNLITSSRLEYDHSITTYGKKFNKRIVNKKDLDITIEKKDNKNE